MDKKTTPKTSDSESDIPKMHQRNKVDDSYALATPELQTRHEKRKAQTTEKPCDTEADGSDSESLAKPDKNIKKQKKECDQDEITALNKKIVELGNCVQEMSGIIKKLSDKSKKEETKKVVEYEYPCLMESQFPARRNSETIFVGGFDCSFPIEEIKKSLKKHFSTCGIVTLVFVPYECLEGRPFGYGFINMGVDPEKALTLHGSKLGGMLLTVVMAKYRTEYYQYGTGFSGCARCRPTAVKFYLESLKPRRPFGENEI